MRARSLWAAAAVFAVAGGGCDWRDFDSLRDTAPVLAVQPPSEFPSGNDFAQLLVATQPPSDGSAAARFVTSALLQTAVSYVTISPGGSASAHLVTSPTLDDLAGQPITAMAAIPGTDRVLMAGGGAIMTLDLSASPPAVTPLGGITLATSAEPYLGVGVAAGALTGGTAPDLAVASGTGLHVYVGGGTTDLSATTSAACPIALGSTVVASDRIQRAVLIAPLVAAGAVIAIGTPGVGGPGNVSFFAADKVAGTLSCLFSLSAPGGEPEFGRSLAVGRVFEQGGDLVVGAPPQHVYVYKWPIVAGASPAITLTGSSPTGNFGAALTSFQAALQVLGSVFVGDPAATVSGQASAGVVVEYPVQVGPSNHVTLSDRSAGTNDAYGSSVVTLPFCAKSPCAMLPVPMAGVATPEPLLLVGGANKAFVYFELFGDPRVK